MPTVMLIHGAWLTPRGWEFFRKRYQTDAMQRMRAESARRRRGR